jgi:hypothetical protein
MLNVLINSVANVDDELNRTASPMNSIMNSEVFICIANILSD